MLSLINTARRTAVSTLNAVARAGNTKPQALYGAVVSGSRRLESTRLFHDSSTRSSSTMHDNDPETLEREKHRNLTGSQYDRSSAKHAPGWNETLASASEATVKADQDHTNPAELTAETIELVSRKHSDPDNSTDHLSAHYRKDEKVVKEQGFKTGVGHEWPTTSEEDIKADRGDPIY